MNRTILLWAAFVSAALPPWLVWLKLKAPALRFVQLRGHWPMCDTALSCLPDVWSEADSVDTISIYDPVRMRLGLADWQVPVLLGSAPAWIILRLAFGKHLPPAARRVLLIAFVLGWACLLLDPTRVVAWYGD